MQSIICKELYRFNSLETPFFSHKSYLFISLVFFQKRFLYIYIYIYIIYIYKEIYLYVYIYIYVYIIYIIEKYNIYAHIYIIYMYVYIQLNMYYIFNIWCICEYIRSEFIHWELWRTLIKTKYFLFVHHKHFGKAQHLVLGAFWWY